MLYRYDGLAYFAHGGRLIATATATTRAQEARVAAMFARLSDQAGRA